MANANLSWTLPATRGSGRPYVPDATTRVEIEVSADLGANWAQWNSFPPDTLEATVTDLEPGEWRFRGRCVDSKGSGPWASGAVMIDDVSPPGALGSFTVALA